MKVGLTHERFPSAGEQSKGAAPLISSHHERPELTRGTPASPALLSNASNVPSEATARSQNTRSRAPAGLVSMPTGSTSAV